jgi:hypothetical protein
MTVLLLTLLLVGQSLLAVSAPCLMMGNMPATSASSATHATADEGMPDSAHAGHHMVPDAMSAEAERGQGCCETGQYCSASACTPLLALPSVDYPPLLAATHFPSLFFQESFQGRSSGTLFRPPIFA